MEGESGAPENLTKLTQISPEKIKKDSQARQTYEVKLEQKLSELHSVRERLYQLRYDYSRPETDIEIDVNNLAGEYNRLQRDISNITKKEIKIFEESLQLEELKLPKLLTSKKMDTPAASTKLDISQSSSYSSKEPVDEHETMEDVPEDVTLMRTKSTQNMEDKTPQEKWQGLFRMFQEWRHQKNVAEASQIMKRKNSEAAMLSDEIIKLRTAIYSMRQRKTLGRSDQDLLKQMTQELNKLTRRSTQLSRDSIASIGITTSTTSTTSTSSSNQTVSSSDVKTTKQDDKSKKSDDHHDDATEKKTNIDVLALLYEYAHAQGFSKEMINPNYFTGKSKEEINEISDKVRKEYFAKKGIQEPKREIVFNIK